MPGAHEGAAAFPGRRFPLERSNERELPAGYAGPVDVWDIDKTYLETEFESVFDLLGRALEGAIDKRARPGARALLRALRRGGGGAGGPASSGGAAPLRTPLYFVSASPPQLRATIEKKMLLDGVEWDGISFKDHLALLRSGRIREVRRHVAYKLTALLEYRLEWPPAAREWLFGDDAETDALIYSLYAEITSGAIGGDALAGALAAAKVDPDDGPRLLALAAAARERVAPAAPAEGSVAGIFIFRAARRARVDLAAFPRVVPVAGVEELARRLHERGRIDAAALEEVLSEAARER